MMSQSSTIVCGACAAPRSVSRDDMMLAMVSAILAIGCATAVMPALVQAEQRHVVEAHERDVVGNLEAVLLDHPQRADGHVVVAAEQRGRRRRDSVNSFSMPP